MLLLEIPLLLFCLSCIFIVPNGPDTSIAMPLGAGLVCTTKTLVLPHEALNVFVGVQAAQVVESGVSNGHVSIILAVVRV
ncbi:hypothetical protein C1922_08860 [Stenotrophomonas sp. ZAC14D2_NAIMI4_7]|nr:hypothetical protein C1922_08860 [Stenotrophomonas sp. ZAC14D2_NAIMI4_7]